ncbi:hypothetical protein ACSBR2_027120 [Camellia fascicularis]
MGCVFISKFELCVQRRVFGLCVQILKSVGCVFTSKFEPCVQHQVFGPCVQISKSVGCVFTSKFELCVQHQSFGLCVQISRMGCVFISKFELCVQRRVFGLCVQISKSVGCVFTSKFEPCVQHQVFGPCVQISKSVGCVFTSKFEPCVQHQSFGLCVQISRMGCVFISKFELCVQRRVFGLCVQISKSVGCVFTSKFEPRVQHQVFGPCVQISKSVGCVFRFQEWAVCSSQSSSCVFNVEYLGCVFRFQNQWAVCSPQSLSRVFNIKYLGRVFRFQNQWAVCSPQSLSRAFNINHLGCVFRFQEWAVCSSQSSSCVFNVEYLGLRVQKFKNVRVLELRVQNANRMLYYGLSIQIAQCYELCAQRTSCVPKKRAVCPRNKLCLKNELCARETSCVPEKYKNEEEDASSLENTTASSYVSIADLLKLCSLFLVFVAEMMNCTSCSGSYNSIAGLSWYVLSCAAQNSVYGCCPGLLLVVAVKQLDRNGIQGNKEFLGEIFVLSLLHHPNLVNLVGYCADGDQRLMVYEYMPLGCVEDHLHDISEDKKALDWSARMKIGSDTAQGLEYLHEKTNPHVIYRDLKSSNILLDEEFNPRLSDFGFAKLGLHGNNMQVIGSYSYCAPEYERTCELTLKSDVHSFGVILLELSH